MNFVKRISTIILAAYMLIAMGGLSLFYHFCTCTNTVITSLIVEETCCEHSIPTQGCCDSTDTNECHSESEKGCDCDTNVKIFRVDNTPTPIVIKTLVEDVNLLVFNEIILSFELNSSEQNQSFYIPTFKSPPKSGRDIVIALQKIKIPESLS